MKRALIAAMAAACLGTVLAQQQGDIPNSVQDLRQAGPLDVRMRTDAGRDVHLRLDQQYPTQTLGDRLTEEQIEKLDTIRTEAPDKYHILACLFPQQIAEFLLRSPRPAGVAAADDPLQRTVWEIGAQYLSEPDNSGFSDQQRRARADFIQAALKTLPPQPPAIQHLMEQAGQYQDPDFDSPAKADTFMVLRDWYSPFRPVTMSIMGDLLRIGGVVVTEHLSTDAAAAGQASEQYANHCYDGVSRALAHWRNGQVTGNAYAGSIRRFLNDPRLADFTPEEVSRAYRRVFGRDLGTDLEADRIAERLGHPVTYTELRTKLSRE